MLSNPVTPADLGYRSLLAAPSPTPGPQAEAPEAPGNVTASGYLWLRLDGQYSNSGTLGSSTTGPKWTAPSNLNGGTGLYFKKAVIGLSEYVSTWAKWTLNFDVTGLRLQDAGAELSKISLFTPWLNLPDWTFDLNAGQFRQHFGLEPQTPDTKQDFNERALMNGGAQPFGPILPRLVGDWALGLHTFHQKNLGLFAYDLGISVVNDAMESQAASTNTLATAFPLQIKDQDPSEIARLGLEPSLLNAFLPFGLKLTLGASAAHDSQNTAYYAGSPTAQTWSDLIGVDARLELAKALRLQAEWVSRNAFGPTALTNIYGGLQSRAEAWYASSLLQPLDFFWAKAPQIQVLARYESEVPNVDTPGQKAGRFPTSYNAITAGLKWVYGNSHTSLNYTVYGLDNDFSSMAGTELVSLQQQFGF